ncbi:thermonuclease family protein [Bacteroidales bacterium OttesenSCG-928-L03]|nr:thermonuclease family protein [Bacteroidales bacterium OttesenSCG-928-L03]
MYKNLSLLIILCLLYSSCDNTSQRRRNRDKVTQQELVNVQQEQTSVTQKKKETLPFKKGEEYYVRVVGISDGDTFTGLTDDNKQVKCRFFGIDAPEKKQAFGNLSKQTLSDLIFDEQVHIIIQSKDQWQRAIVWVFNSKGMDIASEMLKAGMAWHYKKYNNSEEYAELENWASKNRIGL